MGNFTETIRPKVGIATIVIKDGKLLMGKRKGSHGSGTWSVPGGHLEFNETWEECSKRECFEETGVEIQNPAFYWATNDIMKEEGKHYVTIYMRAEYKKGQERITEPEKFLEVGWFDLNNLPGPRFVPLNNLLREKVLS